MANPGRACGLAPLLAALCGCAQTDVVARERACAVDASAQQAIGRCDPALALDCALCSCTDLVTAHPVVVAGDVRLGGGITASSRVEVSGATVERDAPAPGCDAATALDVTALVAARKPTDARAAEQLARGGELRLGCAYTLLLVAGDLSVDSDLLVRLPEGAAVDLLVAGNLHVAGRLQLGSARDAGRVRLLIGGDGTIDLGGPAFVAGPLYAPRAELVTRSSLHLLGPLLVRRAAPGGELRVQASPAGCP